jgi:hypothetical protein
MSPMPLIPTLTLLAMAPPTPWTGVLLQPACARASLMNKKNMTTPANKAMAAVLPGFFMAPRHIRGLKMEVVIVIKEISATFHES